MRSGGAGSWSERRRGRRALAAAAGDEVGARLDRPRAGGAAKGYIVFFFLAFLAFSFLLGATPRRFGVALELLSSSLPPFRALVVIIIIRPHPPPPDDERLDGRRLYPHAPRQTPLCLLRGK